LDGDGDSLETLPLDLSGLEIPFSIFGQRCDAGCFQYDLRTADSDLDGFDDRFERTVSGSSLDLYVPLIIGFSTTNEGIFLDFKFVRNLRDFTDFIFEGSVFPNGPWSVIDTRRRRSTSLNDTENSERRELFSLPGQRFFRVRTIAEN